MRLREIRPSSANVSDGAYLGIRDKRLKAAIEVQACLNDVLFQPSPYDLLQTAEFIGSLTSPLSDS